MQKPNVPLKASLFGVGCVFFSKALHALTLPLFTRILSREEFGTYALYLTLYTAAAAICTLRMTGICLTRTLQKFPSPSTAKGALGLILAFSGGALLLLALLFPLLSPLLGLDAPLFFCLLATVAGDAVFAVYLCSEKYRYRVRAVSVLCLCKEGGAVALSLFLILRFGMGALGRAAAGALLSVLCGLFALFSLCRPRAPLYDRKIWKYLFSLSGRSVLSALSDSLLLCAPSFLVGRVVGRADLSLYSLSHSVGGILSVIVGGMSGTLIPWILRRRGAGDWEKMRRVCTDLCLLLSLGGCGVVLLSPEAIRLFGSSGYTDALRGVLPAVLGAVPSFLYTVQNSADTYEERPVRMGVCSLAALLLGGGLCLYFTRLLGWVGGAWSYPLSLWLLFCCRRVGFPYRGREDFFCPARVLPYYLMPALASLLLPGAVPLPVRAVFLLPLGALGASALSRDRGLLLEKA